jgi:large subunit ribosomal protein L6
MEATEETKIAQSRIGKRPIPVPKGVKLTVEPKKVSLTGPKGTLSCPLPIGVTVEQRGEEIYVKPTAAAGSSGKKYQGLIRALVKNMTEGVSKGFEASIDLICVGYKAELSGKKLTLALGLSHQVQMVLPDSVAAKVEIIDEGGQKKPRLILSSNDKESLGQTAAKIRSFRPPEPYKGKGVRFTGEKVREKAGKAGAKGKK